MTYQWWSRFGGESGPVLITDAKAFPSWTGAVYDDDYQLDPDCDYARAEAAMYPDDDEVEAVPVGSGIVWQMEGAGIAAVATTDDGLLVVRSWTDDDRAAREFAAGQAAREVESGTAALHVDSGQVAVVWAPVAAAETTQRGAQLNSDGILNIGTLAPLRPGHYTATWGAHEDSAWSCRWIRLERTGD